jgi:hypothetical protein
VQLLDEADASIITATSCSALTIDLAVTSR